jgi:hypothetical protein
MALGDDLGRWWCRDDAGLGGTATGRPIPPSAIEAAIGADIDLDEDSVVGAGEGLPGQAAVRALLLLGGDVQRLFNGGQMVMAAAGRTGSAALLTAGTLGRWRDSCWSRQGRRTALLGLAFKELALAETELGAELFDLLLGAVAAGEGVLMHGAPVADLLAQLQKLGSAGAIGGEAGAWELGHFLRDGDRSSRGESIRFHSPVVPEATGASQVSRRVYRMLTHYSP